MWKLREKVLREIVLDLLETVPDMSRPTKSKSDVVEYTFDHPLCYFECKIDWRTNIGQKDGI